MNIQEIMKQAQVMQSKMGEMQKKMAETDVEGTSGGGLVKIVCTCKGEIKSINIDESLMVASEKEILEDLILSAFNNAKKNADEAMKKISGSLGLPKDVLNSLF